MKAIRSLHYNVRIALANISLLIVSVVFSLLNVQYYPPVKRLYTNGVYKDGVFIVGMTDAEVKLYYKY